MTSNKQEFLESTEEFVRSSSGEYSYLNLFDLTWNGFIECVNPMRFGFHGHDYEIMDRIRSKLSFPRTVRRELARNFVEIWFCSNFSASSWRWLVTNDRIHARLAVEHCYFVLVCSGADGSESLTRLLTEHDCWDEAESTFALIRDRDSGSGDWIDRLLSLLT